MTVVDGSSLHVGAGRAEITPPLAVGILMSSVQKRWEPFEGVRLPLHARVVVLRQQGRQVAIVSLELLGVSGKAFGGRAKFLSRIARHANGAVQPGQIILTATHTHSAPETMALTTLYRTEPFRQWVEVLAGTIGRLIREAVESAQPARLAVGRGEAPGLAIHRRIMTTEGIMLSHPAPPPEKVISRDGPVDDSVNVAAFLDSADRPIAVIVNAACHPVHEMCIRQMSPDYPGIMASDLEARHAGATVMFLNGSAGNINPPTVSGGPDDAQRHARRLGEVVEQALHDLKRIDVADPSGLLLLRRPMVLPQRTATGRPAVRPMKTELAGLRLGSAAWVFLPGEPFVEIGLELRRVSPFPFTAVAGYAIDSIGYIPTDVAFDQGGYELGPGLWSRVGRGSADIITRQGAQVLEELGL